MENRKKDNIIKINFKELCAVRLVIMLLALIVVVFYYLLRSNVELMAGLYYSVAKPYHAFMSRLCGNLDFSVAEVLIAAAVIFLTVYIIISIFLLVKLGEKGKRVYITLLTLAMSVLVVWAGFCLLWSPYYFAPSFTEQSGVNGGQVSIEELRAVTEYFATAANEYGDKVGRDGSGAYTASADEILDRASGAFLGASELFPFLGGAELRPKPVFFSETMSRIDFTGFFFPLTGEANLNIDSPICMLPATAEHELAHQRGIAAEQECNFIAVLACMQSGDADFTYSGALMAYIYLGNALYGADYEAWQAVSGTISDSVRADLAYINAYWAQYSDKAMKKASDKVYEAFLQSNGQTLGLKSYGACVDLLVNYYYPDCG